MKSRTFLAVICVMMFAFTSIRCATSTTVAYFKVDSGLMSALEKIPDVSKFTELLKTPGLDVALGSVLKQPFTLLAPNNKTLNALGATALTKLMQPGNITKLADFVKNQIIPGKLDLNALMKGGLKTAGGKAVDLGSATLGKMVSGEKFNVFPIDKLLG
jgi:uncharacterized surface protein with fasciclin (FAS1) repeats